MTKRKPLPCTEANCGELFPRCGKKRTYDAYRCRCDSCRAAKSEAGRRHYQENRERIDARHRAYAAENREAMRQYSRQWFARNPEYRRAYYAANPEAGRERTRRWRENNPEAYDAAYKRARERASASPIHRENVRQAAQRRRARKVAAPTVPFTSEQWAQKVAYWGGRCYLRIPGICTGGADHAEHVKPLSKGGAHMLANLRPACEPCNRRKWNQWPFTGSRSPRSGDESVECRLGVVVLKAGRGGCGPARLDVARR
jgi:5-methylcytosine-specific restriction endonuclease McrA